jgi:hypothetical protein
VEACVDKRIDQHEHLGTYSPWNQCNYVANNIVDECVEALHPPPPPVSSSWQNLLRHLFPTWALL